MLRKGTVDRNDKVTFSTLTKTLNKLAKLRRHVSRVQFTKINFGKMSETRNLKRRMKKHTGKKSYRCFQCDQLFSLPSSLRLHLKSHTGDKPYRSCGAQLVLVHFHQKQKNKQNDFSANCCQHRHQQLIFLSWVIAKVV